MSNEVEARWQEFAVDFEGGEGGEIAALVRKAGDFIETVLIDRKAVDDAMRALHHALFGHGHPDLEARDWRELWAHTAGNDEMGTQGAQFMTSLHAFAYYGLRPDSSYIGLSEDADAATIVKAHVDHARSLRDAIPKEWIGISQLADTVLAAECRLRLDTNADVTPEQLAALARISLKSVRNLLTPKAGGNDIETNAAGEIPGAQAMRWLSGRHGFRSSLWTSPNPEVAGRSEGATEDLGEVVFVPVARDGTWFDPATCRNGRGYTVGAKGSEEPVVDYRDALDRLARMKTPSWRRPNAAGNWGLVSGITWQRKVVSELGGAEGLAA